MTVSIREYVEISDGDGVYRRDMSDERRDFDTVEEAAWFLARHAVLAIRFHDGTVEYYGETADAPDGYPGERHTAVYAVHPTADTPPGVEGFLVAAYVAATITIPLAEEI